MVAVFFLFSFLVWNLPFLGNAKSLPNLKNTIAIFGGTGKLGSECVYQALQRGDNVVVLARDKSKMTIPPGSGGLLAGQSLPDHPQLKLIEGSVTNQKNVDTVFDGNAVTSVIIGESLYAIPLISFLTSLSPSLSLSLSLSLCLPLSLCLSLCLSLSLSLTLSLSVSLSLYVSLSLSLSLSL
jgi:hypothetical protein